MENDVKVYVASLGDAHTQVTLIPDLVNAVPALISRETMEMSFPRHLYPLFEKNSGGVDPYLLLSVARQESTFNPRAISPANAQGLLQLNPVTAKKMMNGATVNLLDPKINVTLGARYLSQMIRTNQGQIFLALAAYNAGQDKVALWRKMFPTDDSILFIDLISYRETRGYVAAVLRNYFWYRRLAEPSEYALKRIVNSGIGPVE
jgi:soluble lytic murein transglycosylase